MRSRKEIEKELKDLLESTVYTSDAVLQRIKIELLLDIRDLVGKK